MNIGMRLAMAISGLLAVTALAQPKADPKSVERRIGEIRARLEANPPADAEQRELATFVQKYLDLAVKALNGGQRFRAERLADAADDCRRPIDRLRQITEADQRPHPPPPPDHLKQVYFRLRLGELFLQQIPDPPKRLLDLAREQYQRALQASQENHPAMAEEYTKAADDLTHALESLAQAYAPDVPRKL